MTPEGTRYELNVYGTNGLLAQSVPMGRDEYLNLKKVLAHPPAPARAAEHTTAPVTQSELEALFSAKEAIEMLWFTTGRRVAANGADPGRFTAEADKIAEYRPVSGITESGLEIEDTGEEIEDASPDAAESGSSHKTANWEDQPEDRDEAEERMRVAIAGTLRAKTADNLRDKFDEWLRSRASSAEICFIQNALDLAFSAFGEEEFSFTAALLSELPADLINAIGHGKVPRPQPEWSTELALKALASESSRSRAQK